MKSWKKRWKDELDAMLPELDGRVKTEPIPTPEYTENVKFTPATQTPWYRRLFSSPRRIASCLSACAVGLIAVGISAFFLFSDSPVNAPVAAEAEVISVEVNPQAAFSVNKGGKVTAVVAINEDADVVLAGGRYLELEGKSVAKAVELFVDYTARLGYLDLNTPDAVCISSCTENGYLSEVSESLESYFQMQGAYIAVAEEVLEMQEFCARLQMDAVESAEELKSSLERIPALSFEREAEGKTDAEAEELYRENVSMDGVHDIFCSAIEMGVKKIEDFEAIDALSDDIREHEDNPGLLLRDYWSILDKEIKNPESDLPKLMQQMQIKLLAYAAEYGTEIDSAFELELERAKCSMTALQSLTAYLLDTSLELFAQNVAAITDILRGLGFDVDKIEHLLDVPRTLTEYVETVNEYTVERAEALQSANREAYERVRKVISRADYAAYINDIVEEYGSLTAYYRNK